MSAIFLIKQLPTWTLKIVEDIRKHAAEQGVAEEEALEQGMKEKSKEFVGQGTKVYSQA